MANFVVTITSDNISTTSGFKYMYRLHNTSLWTTFQTSGNTVIPVSFTGLDNRLYDIQVVNLSTTLNNPTSSVVQDIYFTDPMPVISPTNISVGYYFGNLSTDISDYITTVSLFSNPGDIIGTHTLVTAPIVSDSFSGLVPLTLYYLTITPTANQFSKTFVYTFITPALATCPDPQNIIVTLLNS